MSSEGPRLYKRLHVRDRILAKAFLIDTGADISLVPANPKACGKPSSFVNKYLRRINAHT